MPGMSNQEKEHYYFEMFRRAYLLPDGIVEYRDRPDVIVKGKRTIGIEVTNFFLEDGKLAVSEQRQRAARERVVSEAQAKYQQGRASKKFELWFSFHRAVPDRSRDQILLSEQLADLAARVETFESGQLRSDCFEHIEPLKSVYVNANEYEHPRWHVTQVYPLPIMPLERLQEIIKTKEAKSEHYEPCDSYWLLVVIDFMDRAQDQQILTEDLATVNSQVFEKIVVYKTVFDEIAEIDTAVFRP
jgi:hypothetical protein